MLKLFTSQAELIRLVSLRALANGPLTDCELDRLIVLLSKGGYLSTLSCFEAYA